MAAILAGVTFLESDRPSPNHAVAPAHEQRGVCFHHSVLPFDETVARLTNPASRVSYHVLIHPDGQRARLVDERSIAWHAGESQFRGRTGCNAFLLGVAFAGDTYASPLSPAQIESALDWMEPRWSVRGWSLDDMTDHRQVAPGRKDDLNPREWERLFAAIRQRFGPAR